MVKALLFGVLASSLAIFAEASPYSVNGLLQMVRDYTGYGGTGALGALVVSGATNGPNNPYYINTRRAYLTAAASPGAGSITVNSGSGFQAGDEVLIMEMLGSNAGRYETKTVASTTATSVTFQAGQTLANSYPTFVSGSTAAQIVKIPNFTSVTVNSGGFLTVPTFDGATGGVMFFRSTGGVSINYNATLSGTISVKGRGYAGGGASTAGSGPGGGAVGSGGTNTSPGLQSRAIMGSGGGGATGAGANGGGILIIRTSGTLTVDGNLNADGAAATGLNAGGGAGGTMQIIADTITRTTTCGPISASGGAGNGTGTSGGAGRLFLNYQSALNCTNAVPASTTTYNKYDVK